MTIKQRIGRSVFRRMPITRFLFDQLRWEANAGLRRVENAISPSRRRRLNAIRNAKEIRVNVACGPHVLPGFVNIDLITLPTRMDIVNHVFHQWNERRWGYDYETLAHRLTQAGFENVQRSEYGTSLDSQLANDREVHAPYWLYVEAVR